MEGDTAIGSEVMVSGAGDGDASQPQYVTVQTPDDNTQVIMLTFNDTENATNTGSEIQYLMDASLQTEDKYFDKSDKSTDIGVQTETVFGIKDLPSVAEMVSNTVQNHADISLTGARNGIYTCSLCAKVYRNKVSWQNHLLTHSGKEVYMCGVCGRLFDVRSTLKAHLDMHAQEERRNRRNMRKERGFPINLNIGGIYMPGEDIEDDEELNPLAAITHQDDTHVAATEEVTEEDTLAAIEQLEQSNYIFACNICGEQYTVKADCERHLKVHTGYTEPETPAAPTKPKSSPKHVSSAKADRKVLGRSKFSAYIYACNVCGKQYTNKSNCKRHMRIHSEEEKNYKCDFCHKKFAQKYEVKMHARIHTGEKPYSCAVCGKNFTERGNWRRHTQIHIRPQESSPYRCGICCKGFYQADKLQIHLQIHSGQRPFICTVCGRKAKKIGDMYRHLRTHTGEKPYSCQVCGKGFAQNGNLKDHMKTHTGEKPHICHLCDRTFTRKILLKEHIKNHHGDDERVKEEGEEIHVMEADSDFDISNEGSNVLSVEKHEATLREEEEAEEQEMEEVELEEEEVEEEEYEDASETEGMQRVVTVSHKNGIAALIEGARVGEEADLLAERVKTEVPAEEVVVQVQNT